MALNPIAYTERVVRSFLKYQLTAYPFSDTRLLVQMRRLLNLDEVRHTPLLKGPYISLSRSYREGPGIAELIEEGILHPHMGQIIADRVSHVYGHQERAIRSIREGKTTLVSTGTGSGKTECFLYPIISRCLDLRDAGEAPGISAVLVYPMNALAEDQLDRLRGLLAGSGITFGMYVGKTPQHERQVSGHRLEPGSTRADYEAVLQRYREQGRSDSVHPAEEACSRETMRTPGQQPRILLTNVKQLELLLTRQRDIEMFNNCRLDFLVFDEAHTFGGIQGAETACLIRRLRAFCGRSELDTVCIATSATIVDSRDPNAGERFASRFFGTVPSDVVCVHEEYEADPWSADRHAPPEPMTDLTDLLAGTLAAVDAADPSSDIQAIFRNLTGEVLPEGDWQGSLHDALIANETAYCIREALDSPRSLESLIAEISLQLNRPISEQEVLVYLALGAAAFKGGRPVYRPVVHGYVRGIPGGVVTFPEGEDAQLWLSSEEELSQDTEQQLWRAPVHTCTTCGQHYYVSWLKDFEFTGTEPAGGQLAEGGKAYWQSLDKDHGGKRAVFLDQVISQEEADDLEEEKWSANLFICRHCGSAHQEDGERCLSCGVEGPLVQLYAVKTSVKHPGFLGSCISCKSRGRPIGSRFREPIRAVRAVNVSDVHVLAQDMVHHAERKRLLLFADNRQDAAFQAGWMKDHARRFRLRRLMAEAMTDGPVSVSDMVMKIDDRLDEDDGLSRALIPEVWRVAPKEAASGVHQDERRYFLRIQVLREITTAANQQVGLEPWGRLKVEYHGLDDSAKFIQRWASELGLPASDLRAGIEAFLDQLRRQQLLYDSLGEIFSRFRREGDREIQRGYMPIPPRIQGMKLRLRTDDKRNYARAWVTQRTTSARQIVGKWGVPQERAVEFLEGLWEYLSSDLVKILVPVTLKGFRGTPVAGASGVFQIDAGKLIFRENHGYYRCKTCRRKVTRRTPHNLCMAWQCQGELEFIAEDPDSYDLQLLDQAYAMLRPEEHTAMVPQSVRERIENLFKGKGDAVNTLVCTPTLELGVDIGALDSVLLRNVPPLPANYWQRAGRAGRRHRMAVNICYCRPTSHDRAYFTEPLKMLEGRVDPPSFNLRNELMVAKHVHAAVMTKLFDLAREESGSSETERGRIERVFGNMLPQRISPYLFNDLGAVRLEPFDVEPLGELIQEHRSSLLTHVCAVFRQGWPEDDADVTDAAALEGHIDEMTRDLDAVLRRLRRRLQWAHGEILRLNRARREFGTLEGEDDAHYRRCDRLIKRLKGVAARSRREAEGIDDINTYGVLAAEGFLPGYGLDTGSVIGMAEVPYWQMGSLDFQLPRPTSRALREYVPGNLIYANGHRFVARRFHRDPNSESNELPVFEVSTEREALSEILVGQAAASMGSSMLRAIAVCDVDLVHQSQIDDEEETRFQMPVAVYGREIGRHSGGNRYAWGNREVTHRRGVHLQLVNVGASPALEGDRELGYPVCTVCGQSVSPLASERQITHFRTSHRERCGQTPKNVGFYADVTADCLTIPKCEDRIEAFSMLEALRMGAAHVLDMHREDLQITVIGHIDRDEVDALLWDPMPGGSGLLDQIIANFKDVVTAADEITRGCPAQCEHSCIDCLQTFRNSYYHKYLDRFVVIRAIDSRSSELTWEHEIPAEQPQRHLYDSDAAPVNDGEAKLKYLLEAAGFMAGEFQQQIRFNEKIDAGHIIGSTTPDVSFAGDPDEPDDKGICIYLDGLSARLHGNPRVAEKDIQIRNWLRNNGYQVISISYVELDDRSAMVRHFRKLARYLSGRDMAARIAKDTSWMNDREEA
jgi:ATP-dependent helicase YprA (DUF1998 family)